MRLLDVYRARICKDYRCATYKRGCACMTDGLLCSREFGLTCRYEAAYKLGGCESCQHVKCIYRCEQTPKVLQFIYRLAV